MSRQAFALVALFVVGAAVSAGLVLHRDRQAGAPSVADLERRLAAVEARARAPEVAVVHPPAPTAVAPSTRAADAAPPVGLGAADADARAMPPFMDADAAAERRRFEAAVLERTLAAEQVDVAASNTFAQGLTQALGSQQELAGSRLLGAECRVSLCRIAVLQTDMEDVETFLGNVGNLPGFGDTDTYWQRQLNADGSSVMTMYVARPGHPMPDYRMPAAGP
jgi:hypothetical protein